MNTTSPKFSAVRAPGREHVPLYPRGFIAVRIIQLVLAVIILGLAAFGVWWAAFDGDCFILAVAIMTLITSTYHLVAEFSIIAWYNYWAVLGLDILLIVMWLSSFALLASEVSSYFNMTSYSYYGYVYGLSGIDYIVVCCLAAASALGGVQFVLHTVALVIHSINLHRHRAAGLHCTPIVPGSPPAPAPAGAAAVATTGTEKSQIVYQTVTAQPAPTYIQPYPVQVQAQTQQFYPQQGQVPVQLPANQIQPQPTQ